MNRATELELLAATIEEPGRALMRAAIVAQRQGRLDAAARVAAEQVLRRPSLRWAGLLLALEATELRLGGSVAITTPSARFAMTLEFPLFEERWGPFGAIVYPHGERLHLELAPAKPRHALFDLNVACLDNAAAPARGIACSKDAAFAVLVLARELEAHLGAVIRPMGVAFR